MNPREVLRVLGSTPGSALLESVRDGRWSIFVTQPKKIARTWSACVRLTQSLPKLTSDLSFCGGVIALLPYELGADFEGINIPSDDVYGLPEVWAGLYMAGIVWDHEQHEMILFGWTQEQLSTLKKNYDVRMSIDESRQQQSNISDQTPKICSNFTKAQYIGAIRKIQQLIRAGYTFQVNLSQRFMARVANLNPRALYTRLAETNPAPFAGYLDIGSAQIVSSSPELLFRVERGVIETWPIAGTRPRGVNAMEDRQLARELQSSGKELAEHTMLVDLLRNDLGRVAAAGSVVVERLGALEKYARVQHLVSHVVGRLRRGLGFSEIVRAIHPGGTITGCPKVETMRIIADLEKTQRGAYTGALGYVSANGNQQFNILIRTITCVQDQCYWSAGGGIVADSIPQAEYAETLAKAEAVKRAVLSRSK